MEIIKDPKELETIIKDILAPMYRNESLIPFIGSGFTTGCITNSKREVPSVSKTIEIMVNFIIRNNPDLKKTDFDNKSLDQVSEFFFDHVSKDSKNKFLFENFTGVKLDSTRQAFIKLKWPFIYTLNIDDAIERVTNYEKIAPYREINNDRKYLINCIFKLHGDANHEIKYNDENSIIFSHTQYIRSLNENKSIMNYFSEDFFSKNLIFIGCSLQNEIDLEYAIEVNKIKNSTVRVERIYVSSTEPDIFRKKMLTKFGITKFLVVNSYEDFYNSINKYFESIVFLKRDLFSKYLNLKLKELHYTDTENNRVVAT